MPFTVLRRLDCVLEATKASVLIELVIRKKAGVNPEPFLLRKSFASTASHNTLPGCCLPFWPPLVDPPVEFSLINRCGFGVQALPKFVHMRVGRVGRVRSRSLVVLAC